MHLFTLSFESSYKLGRFLSTLSVSVVIEKSLRNCLICAFFIEELWAFLYRFKVAT